MKIANGHRKLLQLPYIRDAYTTGSSRLDPGFYGVRVYWGVNKRATNFATLSELGRFPLHFDIIKSMIHYWHRLENLDSNFILLKDAYEESKQLFEIKIPSWHGSITLLIKNIRGLKELSNVSNHKL